MVTYANKDQLKDVDPVTKRPPFVLAALNDTGTASCDLSTIYYLLREHPEHIKVFRRNKKRKISNVEVGYCAIIVIKTRRRRRNSNST